MIPPKIQNIYFYPNAQARTQGESSILAQKILLEKVNFYYASAKHGSTWLRGVLKNFVFSFHFLFARDGKRYDFSLG